MKELTHFPDLDGGTRCCNPGVSLQEAECPG